MVNEGDKNSAPSGGGVGQTLQTAGTWETLETI